MRLNYTSNSIGSHAQSYTSVLRNSRPVVFCKKHVLEISQKFTEKTCARAWPQASIPNTTPQACNFIKKETLTQLFSCELCEIFIRTPFLQGTSGGFFWVLKCPWASTIKFVANIVEGLKYFTIFVNKLHPWYLVRSHLCFRLGRTKCTKSCKNHAKLFSPIKISEFPYLRKRF